MSLQDSRSLLGVGHCQRDYHQLRSQDLLHLRSHFSIDQNGSYREVSPNPLLLLGNVLGHVTVKLKQLVLVVISSVKKIVPNILRSIDHRFSLFRSRSLQCPLPDLRQGRIVVFKRNVGILAGPKTIRLRALNVKVDWQEYHLPHNRRIREFWPESELLSTCPFLELQ